MSTNPRHDRDDPKGKPVVRMWTDGSACPDNPGPGGWATVLIFEDHEIELSGSTPWSSNIRMELTAVLRGLQYLDVPSFVVVYTDSQYIVDGFRNILHRNKLLKSHYDVWGLILHLSQIHQVRISKVKAHSGVEGNERVDVMARTAARGQLGDTYMWGTERLLEHIKLEERRQKLEKKSWEW